MKRSSCHILPIDDALTAHSLAGARAGRRQPGIGRRQPATALDLLEASRRALLGRLLLVGVVTAFASAVVASVVFHNHPRWNTEWVWEQPEVTVGPLTALTRTVTSKTCIRTPAAFALLAALALLCGCSSTAAAPSAAPSVTAEEPTASRTAEQVVTELVSKVPAARPGGSITARTDPNKLLGRPGQYTSAAIFTDSRVSKEDRNPDTLSSDNGGKVEVFASAADAERRRAYIQRLAEASPIAVEYSYVTGPVLVRVSKNLEPAAAQQYRDALAPR